MDKYLIYYYQGNVKIKRGDFDPYGNFVPSDNPKKYHAKIPICPLDFYYGKTWCYEKDIPKAVELIRARRKNYFKNIETSYERIKSEVIL